MQRGTKSVGERFTAIETRLEELGTEFESLKNEFLSVKEETVQTKSILTQVSDDLADIRAWVDGTAKVAGFARKHWKTALTFGCGIMTAAGVGNPNVIHFVQTFFGIN